MIAPELSKLRTISDQVSDLLVDGRVTDAMAKLHDLNHQIEVTKLTAEGRTFRVDL